MDAFPPETHSHREETSRPRAQPSVAFGLTGGRRERQRPGARPPGEHGGANGACACCKARAPQEAEVRGEAPQAAGLDSPVPCLPRSNAQGPISAAPSFRSVHKYIKLFRIAWDKELPKRSTQRVVKILNNVEVTFSMLRYLAKCFP